MILFDNLHMENKYFITERKSTLNDLFYLITVSESKPLNGLNFKVLEIKEKSLFLI